MEARVLGDYNVIKPIGQGSLGVVFLAEHRFMKRQYVLKVLPEELASDRGFIQRFEEEVGKLASLDHPNIVKIHNISYDQGQYFLVTDCIVDDFGETTNLAQYLLSRGKRIEEEELFRMLRQIAEALDYAHQKKINHQNLVHRNLKPNNILIGKGRGAIDLYISDFGLSKIIGPGAVLTRTYKAVADALGISGVLNGTKGSQEYYPTPPIDSLKLTPLHTSFLQNYAFLAPEQKRLDGGQPVDAKVDVFAFGVLTYFLLMGELPEGIFEMPSQRGQYKWNWDHLLHLCLQNYSSKRPDLLVEVLESIRKTERFIALSKQEHQSTAEQAISHVAEPCTIHEPLETSSLVDEKQNIYFTELAVTVPDQEEMLVERSEEKIEPVVQAGLKASFFVESVPQSKPAEKGAMVLRPVILGPQLERPQCDPDPAAAFRVDQTVKVYQPEKKEIPDIFPLLTDMVVIKGGVFFRGSSDGNRDETPRHQITLSSFAIDIHPVTNEQFVRFLEAMGGEKDTNHHDIIRMRDSRIKRTGGKLSIESGYAKHPVVGVTWYGSIAYARWVGKRLPTEAEWEVAARGSRENSLFPTGEDIEKTQANFFSSDTTSVMSYAPNGYGLYDMAGNVYEWCYDWYGYNYYEMSVQEPDNPKGPLQGVYRVLRGGCWKSLKEDLRCSRRHRNNPGTVNGTYGFRCAADVQPLN